MKKVKIALSAIAVVAVVGGALAFKAETFSSKVLYFQDPETGLCNITRTSIISTNTSVLPKVFVSTTNLGPCTETYTTASAD